MEVDSWLQGGLAREALHEVFAARQADATAAAGFATLLALRAISRSIRTQPVGSRRLVWVRQDFLDQQVGQLHPPGLAALGLNPALLVLVRAASVRDALRAAHEVARSGGVGAVLVELWGESALLDFTASRRLSLAAEATGTPLLLLRIGVPAVVNAVGPNNFAPSAAASRWVVSARPSRPLAANAPGPPAFVAQLQRGRGREAGNTWHLDWDHERQCFRDCESTKDWDATKMQPGAMVPVSAGRAAAGDGGWAAG